MMATSMQRLSSGLRVNSAKDDASGMAISKRFEAQDRGMQVAIRNASDGISVAQTAENAMGQVGDMLQRMRELAVQSANGTLTTSDRSNLQDEFASLQSEIIRVMDVTDFNGKKLLNGSGGSSMIIQVGANNTSNNTITISNVNLTATGSTGVGSAVSAVSVGGGTASAALAAIGSIDNAIDAVTTARANMGAVQSRFESAINVLRGSREQVAAANGRITDTDFASETANLTKLQILQQAGVAMLSQANQTPQTVLSLLR
jgi:flagellin